MLIAEYLYRLALRRGFTRLLNELSSNDLKPTDYEEQSDMDITLAAIGKIFSSENDFEHYDKAIELLEYMRENISDDGGAVDILFHHVLYYAKLLHVLSKTGRQTDNDVIDLLQHYFPKNANDAVATFAHTVTRDNIHTVREFILQHLAVSKRSMHLAKNKFPAEFADLTTKLRDNFARLCQTILSISSCCELELPFDELPDEAKYDPAVLLYYENFWNDSSESTEPSEDQLVAFVRQLTSSQLTVPPPPSLVLPSPPEVDLAQSQPTNSQRSSYRGRKTTGSDDLFASENSKSPLRSQMKDVSIVLPRLDLSSTQISKVYDAKGNVLCARSDTRSRKSKNE